MSEVIKCDWCGATARRGALVNWWGVEPLGMRVSALSDPDQGERHFCSRSCVGSWALDATQPVPVSKAES